MATILLNGVAIDANSITGTDLADKLTVSGGVDGLEVQMSGGDDAVEIYADSEDVSGSVIRMGEGDDLIEAVAASGVDADGAASTFNGTPVSLGDSLIGGPGEDRFDLGDGLVSLTGTIKGNEDDDTIVVAHASGGMVQGNSGDDNIVIGFSTGVEAGSRAEVSLTDASINGSAGDDTIRVTGDAELNDSTIRGNEGDDSITILDGAEATGSVAIEGNAGDDDINAADLEGAATIRGGKGDDILTAGNGQTVFGGFGADTFVVGASGGVTIEDFDKLDLDGDVDVDDPDCFCDDSINIQNIAFETTTYSVERIKYTSASNWTGDIKVKAVADAEACPATATVTLAATKTETLNATAVARLFIQETNVVGAAAAAKQLTQNTKYAVTYPAAGLTIAGGTFVNGNAPSGALKGIGQAFGSAEGFWWNTALSAGSAIRTFKGAVNNVVVQTSVAFEKGDFSFLQLTATEKAGCTTNQKLVFSDITNATVKNHWASYNKVKNTGNDVNLYSMNFGTANFNEVVTGKAYMVITDLEDKAYKTTTLDATVAGATAKVTLDLDDTFQAWRRVGTGAGTTPTSLGNFSWTQILYTGTDADRLLDPSAVTYASLQSRNELTLTTTARNTGSATANSQTNRGIIQKLGVNNTARTKDDFITAQGQLVVKIAVSETATAKATKALGTLVERTVIFGEELDITTCPDFPTVGSLASGIVDGQAKQGDVTGTFNTKYLWADANLNLGLLGFATGTTKTGEDLEGFIAKRGAGDGFFSGTAFSVDVLEAAGFGDLATLKAANTDAKDVPFRVLFFDNDGSDNGLYIMSGLADYNDGALTGINTAPTTSSAMGGKHTIVKVAGGKGKTIELSDINFI